jgi:nitrite reductase (NO-forming)
MFDNARSEVRLSSRNYVFTIGEDENPTITVVRGTMVTVVLSSQQGSHDWVLADDDGAAEEELARTERVSAGQNPVSVTFAAERVGDHVYYCSVGNHRQRGMEGRFVVVEPEH